MGFINNEDSDERFLFLEGQRFSISKGVNENVSNEVNLKSELESKSEPSFILAYDRGIAKPEVLKKSIGKAKGSNAGAGLVKK